MACRKNYMEECKHFPPMDAFALREPFSMCDLFSEIFFKIIWVPDNRKTVGEIFHQWKDQVGIRGSIDGKISMCQQNDSGEVSDEGRFAMLG